MNIILLGYMGVGKTSISKLLSKRTNIPCYDLDEIIEAHENQSVISIFEAKGELYFRKIEHKLFSNFVATNDNYILSLGGGTPCYSNNHLLIQNKNIESFYLKSSVLHLAKKLCKKKNKRPLIKKMSDKELEEFIAKHLFERSYYYQQAKHIISVEGKTKNEIAEMIITLL